MRTDPRPTLADLTAECERFVAGVHRAGGDAAVTRLWDGPASLPTDAEMDDPAAWVRRVMPAAPATVDADAVGAASAAGSAAGGPR